MPSATHRIATRRERYNGRLDTAQKFPVSIATINFGCDENLGYIIRAAACFGCSEVHVIGKIPERAFLSSVSGSLVDYVNLTQHASPHDFLVYAKQENMILISAELHDRAVQLEDYNFDFSSKTCIVLGNEKSGVPEEIAYNSDVVMIPMHGVGACLNTAQTGNIILYEYTRRYANHMRNHEHLCVG
jgi:tRNA G18 (ribose-2'-O)-methylase SpoU